MPEIFLSYSHSDRAWADQFSASLQAAGVEVWFDAHHIQPGDRWAEQVEQALRASDTMIFILSPSSSQSPWTFFEWGAAVADRKRIIPVLGPDMAPEQVPDLMRGLQFLTASSPSEAGKQVARALGMASAGKR
ncbi:MAG TPA: toll/interleukin-1 receptor domain-containing protein [Aggregatilineaceae bacterium]|nr:toll/interleukin-1 receptor domain-containing protein [Aggregatilineaceae bacterium]